MLVQNRICLPPREGGGVLPYKGFRVFLYRCYRHLFLADVLHKVSKIGILSHGRIGKSTIFYTGSERSTNGPEIGYVHSRPSWSKSRFLASSCPRPNRPRGTSGSGHENGFLVRSSALLLSYHFHRRSVAFFFFFTATTISFDLAYYTLHSCPKPFSF